MPTYDYECRACGKTVEYFQPISEAPKKICPACGQHKLERLLGTGAGFIFKGTGFHVTDYRSSDYRAKANADSGGTSSPSGTSSGSKSSSDSSTKK